VALAVQFYLTVNFYFQFAVTCAILVIAVVALINCLTQRADAFPVVGSLTKVQWVLILLACVLASLGCGILYPNPFTFLFLMAAITATAVYLLDVRPALRDTTNGSGNW
jgi:hypothetical protein